MKSSSGGRPRPVTSLIASERGALLMFVLLVMLLIAAITLTVMQFIAADQAAGIRELQAVEVFNVAEAGVHYAIGQLQQSGASADKAWTQTITAGSTTLGTAQITVNCIDTGAVPPCSGTWAAYRRIISIGTLPIAGPTRTIVAVVQGSGSAGNPYAVCGYQTIMLATQVDLFGDLGSNGAISLLGNAAVNGDPNTPQKYTGVARANGSISCSAGCGNIQGGAFPNTSGTLCPAVATGPFAFSGSNLTVGSTGFTINALNGLTWFDVQVSAATCAGAQPYNDLKIQTGAAGTTTVVQMRTLTMGNCTRLIVVGAGNADLRIGLSSGAGLVVGSSDHFGVGPSDTQGSPAPVAAGQLTVEVNSNSSCATTCAASLGASGVISGVFLVPAGEIDVADSQVSGALVANVDTFEKGATFTYDASAGIGAATYSNFNNLRSWKDQ
ncbi:MAG TPA: hypothetical protein VKV57_17330 [bacterium]|nr:hypothetical protein [bacterium]